MVLAACNPTCKAPIKPGPLVTATASSSSKEVCATSNASFITIEMFSACNLEAISGMTPPYLR